MKYQNYKDKAIVISSVNYGESDKILTLFGEHLGKFSIIAKGIRKIKSKNRGNLQTLFLSEITFVKSKKSNLGILKESSLIDICDYNLEDLDEVKKVLFILNKFLAEGEEESKIFHKTVDLMVTGFQKELVNKYRILLLKELGFVSNFNACTLCDEESEKYFFRKTTFEIFCENCYGVLSRGRQEDFIPMTYLKGNVSLVSDLLDKYILRILI